MRREKFPPLAGVSPKATGVDPGAKNNYSPIAAKKTAPLAQGCLRTLYNLNISTWPSIGTNFKAFHRIKWILVFYADQ